MELPVLPESVRDGVVPPDPVHVKRGKPFPKWGGQLLVRVAREDEERLEHGLPRCFGLAARGLDIWPAGRTMGMGLELAVPCFREDVGSCCVAHVRQVGEAHVEPNLIEQLATGWLQLLACHDFIDRQIKDPTWRNGSQGALE